MGQGQALKQGQIVSKEDLLSALWGEGGPVGEDILKVYISTLR
jgi:DNA-binding response OmpR family regulator